MAEPRKCWMCEDAWYRVPEQNGNPAIHPVWGGRGYNVCALSNAEFSALTAEDSEVPREEEGA